MSACKNCGAAVVWHRNERGWWLPINAKGGMHRCQRMERNHITGASVEGAQYKPACGECDVPPWERCACSDVEEAVAA